MWFMTAFTLSRSGLLGNRPLCRGGCLARAGGLELANAIEESPLESFPIAPSFRNVWGQRLFACDCQNPDEHVSAALAGDEKSVVSHTFRKQGPIQEMFQTRVFKRHLRGQSSM